MDPNRINEFGVSKEMLDAHNKCEPKQSDPNSETTPALSLPSPTSSDPDQTFSDSDHPSEVTSSVRKRKSGSLKK